MRILITFLVLLLSYSFGFADSKYNREKRSIQVTRSTGIHIPSLITSPYNVGIIVNADQIVGMEYGENNFNTKSNSFNELDGYYVSRGVYFNHFFSNSFNLRTSLNERKFSVYVSSTIFDNELVYNKVKGEVKTLSFALNNQLTTKNGMIVAIDWFVLSKNINSSINTEVNSFVKDEEIDKRSHRDLREFGELINKTSEYPGAFIIYIGWSF